MSDTTQSESKPKNRYEARATEFGNSAHITVPKDWRGGLVRVEHIGDWCPPLFAGIEQGTKVFVETDTEEELSGEVFKFEHNTSSDGMSAYILFDTGHEIHRIETSRDVGDDGWPDDYTLKKAIGTDEIHDSDEILHLDGSVDGGAIWEPDGRVNGLAIVEQP